MFRLLTFPLLLLAVVAGGGNDLLSSVISSGMSSVPGIITMVLGLCLLITIHELGHWLVARLFGFQTPVFSIGFGKREWRATTILPRGGTAPIRVSRAAAG